MKNFLAVAAAVICFAAIGFSGCFDLDKVRVSTLSELRNVKQNDNVVLTQDIDCDYSTVSGIFCKSFDGNGHTIKNAVLSGNAFFPLIYTSNTTSSAVYTNSVSNITFENIVCNATSDSAAIVAGSVNGIALENVTVKNSTLKIPESNSTVYAGIFVDKVTDRGAGATASFKNCYAENVDVQIGASGIDSIDSGKKWSNVCLGGLIGYALDLRVENCGIKNCDFSVTGCASQAVNVGGLVGYFDELRDNKNSVSGSYVKDTYITAIVTNATKWGTNTGDARVGGLAGYIKTSGSVTECYSSGNNIAAVCSGEGTVGGLIGNFTGSALSSCYSSDNYVYGGYCETGKRIHTVAGLTAIAKNCALSSCFTYNNLIMTDDRGGIEITTGKNGEHYLSDTTYSKIAGFIASANTVTATFCGAYNTLRDSIHDRDGMLRVSLSEMEEYGLYIDDVLDEFWFGGTAVSCYVTEPFTAANSQNLQVLSKDDWLSPGIKNKLNLTGGKWVFEDGKAPCLSL